MSKLKRFLLSSLQIIVCIIVLSFIGISTAIGFVVGLIFKHAKKGFEFAIADFNGIFEEWLEK